MFTAEDAARRRAMRTLFAGVALGTTGFVVSLTVSPLAAEDITNRTSLTGLPWTAGVLGTGIGATLLSRIMARRGRRYGLIAGYSWGSLGAILAVTAVVVGSLPLLILGTLVFGIGNSASHLARYAASDLYPPERRASALGTVAWAGTVGGVIGPNLLSPSGRIARAVELPELSGPFVVTMAAFVIATMAYVVWLRIATPSDELAPLMARPSLLRLPQTQMAAISLAAAQIVMLMVMTQTPVHIHGSGHGLGTIGVVLSAHVLGMYGLSPISGRLTDRFGSPAVILSGFALMAAAAIGGALMPTHAGVLLSLPLFVLGLGWSFSFVAGSALLTLGLSYVDRTRLQGSVDALVWTSAAVASASSGFIVTSMGYVGLCVVASLLVVLPMGLVASRRKIAFATP